MNMRWLTILAALSLSGCASQTDHVLFVTNTSLGLDFAAKPPTASIAYHRAEAYLGPSYSNGAIPPVVATFGTGGNIFAPEVRQVYATGAAALLATDADDAAAGPAPLSGNKKMTFFGTGTTLGLKVGFGETGAPDSMTFGYKRQEFSYIPLGANHTAAGDVDVYPSVLAAIDSTTQSGSLQQAGLRTQQFFATGLAADALAQTDDIRSLMHAIAVGAAADALTPSQKTAFNTGLNVDTATDRTQLAAIQACVAPAGAFDAMKWANLIAKAKTASPKWRPPQGLDAVADWKGVSDLIGDNTPAISSLSKPLPATPSSC